MRKLRLLLTLAFALFVVTSGPIGCKSTLAPDGVYQGDKFLYNAEKTITTSYDLLHSFVQWELDYRAILPVEVSRAADTVRIHSKRWVDSAIALRDAYAASPTPQNKDKLVTALNILDTALTEAGKFMVSYKSQAPNAGLVKPK